MPSDAPPVELSWDDCVSRCGRLLKRVRRDFKLGDREGLLLQVYPVPRGGIPAALLFASVANTHKFEIVMTDDPLEADLIIDDIIDTGRTMGQFGPTTKFYALVDKRESPDINYGWVTFPWEKMSNENGPEENVRRIIEFVGEDPDREGLKETPARVVRAWKEMTAGYGADIKKILKTFPAEGYPGVVLEKDIDFVSTCEHHMLPFVGVAHIAYIPDGRIVGASKLARLVDAYARRLQVQERMTVEIVNAFVEHVRPKSVWAVVEAHHSCMSCRGVGKPNARFVTSWGVGPFIEKPEARAELEFLIGMPSRR